MSKFDKKQWRHAVEQEFQESIKDVVAGFAAQGQSPELTASSIGCSVDDLRAFSHREGITWRTTGRRSLVRQLVERRKSETRAETIRRWHRESGRGRLADISELTGLDKRTISIRIRRGYKIHQAAGVLKRITRRNESC